MCDETDLHRGCCVCGIGGTCGLVSARDRAAKDSQAVQRRMGGKQGLHSGERQDQARVHSGMPRRAGRGAAPAVAGPAGKDQYATEAEAKANCPADTVVWVNPRSMVYHLSDSRNYGQTKQGAYMCEKDSVGGGFHPPKGAARTAT